MGAANIPLFAYVDETGNTGHNLFDQTQPDFYTAALITKGDFDLAFAGRVGLIAQKLGAAGLHAQHLGVGKLESVAPDILNLLRQCRANFFVSRVEKKYLLGTKVFDCLFDSGENAAVAWHHYNLRPLKIMLAFKTAFLLDMDTAKLFWACILEPKEDRALAMLPDICTRMLANLGRLPDAKSREVLGQGLEWARDHPESMQIHTDRRSARQGHFPNMVAFANLLDGLEHHSQRTRRAVAKITHDRQSEFQKTLSAWHDMFSHAAADEVTWAGETYSMQRVVGSTFAVAEDETSAGIQIADVVLWLYHQFRKGRPLPRGLMSILEFVFENGWESDFSFAGVERAYLEKWRTVMDTPLAPEKEAQTRLMLEQVERNRQASMARYEQDKLPPFMRHAHDNAKKMEGEPVTEPVLIAGEVEPRDPG